MKRKRNERIALTAGVAGAMAGLYGVISFNRSVLGTLPLAWRMVSMIPVYLLIALIPGIIMLLQGNRFADYGFTKQGILRQILAGLGVGVLMSCALTLLPHLLGFGACVDNGKRYRYLWQFAYEFVYCVCAVGFAEEFVFRGFVYQKLRSISAGESVAVIGSSALFGLFHLFGGNGVQMVMTACIGALLCCCRLKVKSCSTLSLIVAHGVYDALITVWASLLL